ncbi:MAG: hypothetical protein HY689_13905 [Chloroflexi bacterium]|nr:hypothetical protein [Chloroflexota bacterium]
MVALGPALIASIRGQDAGYLGTPHPTGAATRALAVAWRGQPETTSAMMEQAAVGRPEDAKYGLAHTVWQVGRCGRAGESADAAIAAVVAFCIRRLTGDWGQDTVILALEELEALTRTAPQHMHLHANALLAELLRLCHEPAPSLLLSARQGESAVLAELEQVAARLTRQNQRHRLARMIGHLTAADPAQALGDILAVLAATTGDEQVDRRVRVTLLSTLEEAASPRLLRDLLPVAYSALLGTDPAVRAAGIGLWAKCARVASDALPEDFADFATPLLNDPYLVVHQALLRHLPALRIPARLAPDLLPLVYALATYYREREEPNILEDAVSALRHLASQLADPQSALRWDAVALWFVDRLRPYDLERRLLAAWPDELRAHPRWSSAALKALASPELAQSLNRRHNRLFSELLDHPRPVATIPIAEVEALSDAHSARYPWPALEPVELLQSAGRWQDAAALAARVARRVPSGREGANGRALTDLVAASAQFEILLAGAPNDNAVRAAAQAVRDAADALTANWEADGRPLDRRRAQLLEVARARVDAAEALRAPATTDRVAVAATLDQAAARLEATASARHASAVQRRFTAAAWRIAGMLCRYDAAVRRADPQAQSFLDAAERQADVLLDQVEAAPHIPVAAAIRDFCALAQARPKASEVAKANASLAGAGVPAHLVDMPESSFAPPRYEDEDAPVEEPPLAVCVASLSGQPITDVLVVRPHELYTVGMSVRLPSWPDWAATCQVEPVSRVGRNALTLPSFAFDRAAAVFDDAGVLLEDEQPLQCSFEQPIGDPPLDCPLVVRFVGADREERAEVAGYRRLRLRPFDPSRDALTQHEQTDARLLKMFEALTDPRLDTEDARAFCRLYSACVRAAQSIMFNKAFRRGSRVREGAFHDEPERLLRADPELGGRLTRRDAVAGGFDDLLHDDIIAELKVVNDKPVTLADCAQYLGQPTQYAADRGSQLSVLVVLDHSPKEEPPGVMDNDVGWLVPELHGLNDPAYPSLVGVLIVRTNWPKPSDWSRKKIKTRPLA